MTFRRFMIGLIFSLAIPFWLCLPAQVQAQAQASEEEPPAGWSYLTLDRNFERLPADWRDPYTGFKVFGVEDRDGTGSEASLGAYVGFARHYNPDLKQTWQIGLEAGFFALFDWADGGSLDSRATDYWVGFNTTFSQGPWQGRLVLGHLSSHPGDWTLNNEDPNAEKVSWEVLKGTVSWSGLEWLRIYAGGALYLTHTEWSGKGDIQTGLILQYPIEESPLTPYLAFDLQFRERTDWKASCSFEAGVKIAGQDTDLGLRIYGFYYNGDNPSGTFRLQEEIRYGAGLCVDF